MIKLTSRKRPGDGLGGGIPAHQTTLAVSWLGKQFHALAVQRGTVTGSWTSPDPVEGTNHFATLLRRAMAETGFRSGTVSLVLTHPRLVHQLVEVPPVKGQPLDKAVARQARVQSQSLFQGEPVWSYQPAESDKANPRLLLNLFPKLLLDDLSNGARDAGSFLNLVAPAVAVLQSQLMELPAEPAQVVMLAADTGETTTVVVGRVDGRVLLSRALPAAGAGHLDRLAVDLKRTVLFVNQQFGVPVSSLWLFGPEAAAQGPALRAQLDLPVQPSPTPWTADYWAAQLLRLQPAQTQNLITREQQQAPQRRVLATVSGVLTLLLLLGAVGASVVLRNVLRREEATLAELNREVATLQVRHRELQDLAADLARRQEMVKQVVADRPPPVPGWLLGYLSDALPDTLVVTNLTVQKQTNLWKLRVAGRLQPTVTNAPPGTLARAVTQLTNTLATGPFHVRFSAVGLTEKPPPRAGAGVTPAPGLISRVSAQPVTRPAGEAVFQLEGLVKP